MNFLGTDVVFGSQTGTAQDVAYWMKWRLRDAFKQSSVLSGNEFEYQFTLDKVYIFILSTAGNGDPPLNFRRLWDTIFHCSMYRLEGIKFAIFGLGDSKYTQFNYAARMLFGRLENLGAEAVIPLGCGDEQHKLGYSQEFIPWFRLLWQTVTGSEFSPAITPPKSITSIHSAKLSDPPGFADSALVLSNTRLTPPSHFQEVRHITLRLPGVWEYMPGDVLTVFPRISIDLAQKFIIEILNRDPSEVVHIKSESGLNVTGALQYFFTQVFDITATPNHFFYEILYLSYLNQLKTPVSEEQETVLEKLALLAEFSSQGAAERLQYSYREKMSIYEVLFDFVNVGVGIPDLQRLVDCLPPIAPRYYSVCNALGSGRNWTGLSRSTVPSTDVEICVGIVDYTTLYGRHRRGLASGFIQSLCPGQFFTQSFRLDRGFTSELPKRIESVSNMILVAPGTGIAPARAIIEKFSGRKKKILLLSSFRNPKTDFLFQHEIQNGWKGVTSVIGWSRPDNMDRSYDFAWSLWSRCTSDGPGSSQGRKTWVQDLVPMQSGLIRELIGSSSCLVLVCGRSHPMPQQVRDELAKIHSDVDSMIVYDTWG